MYLLIDGQGKGNTPVYFARWFYAASKEQETVVTAASSYYFREHGLYSRGDRSCYRDITFIPR